MDREKTFAEMLREYRIRKKLRISELAERLNASRKSVTEWEMGKRVPRDRARIDDLGLVLGLSQSEIEALDDARRRHIFEHRDQDNSEIVSEGVLHGVAEEAEQPDATSSVRDILQQHDEEVRWSETTSVSQQERDASVDTQRLTPGQRTQRFIAIGVAIAMVAIISFSIYWAVTTHTAALSAQPFELLDHVLDARWFNNNGLLPEGRPNLPGSGEATLRGPITLEDGRRYERALFTHPKYTSDGFIRGEFDIPIVRKGQHFLAKVGFEPYSGPNGVIVRITFRDDVLYIGTKRLTNRLDVIDVDMSRYDGLSGILGIEIHVNNSSSQDWFWWVDPRLDYPQSS